MPSWVKDEATWEKAKARAKEEYPDKTGDDFWRVVAGIYKKMGGEVTKAILVLKSYPKTGDRIEFDNDRFTDKGPSSGEIIGTKITVDGLYIKVRHSDGEEQFSWEDLKPHAVKRDGGWFVKSHPALYPGPVSPEQAEAGNYKKRKILWHGLTISIENEAGTVRKGKNRDGMEWETRMIYPYGYINRTEGVDGDAVDCYVGPCEDAAMVYVVHQRKFGDWSKLDEDKAMLNFASEDDARAAYLKHYTDPRFLGPITAMPVDEFVEKVRATKEKPAVIKSVVVLKAIKIKFPISRIPGLTDDGLHRMYDDATAYGDHGMLDAVKSEMQRRGMCKSTTITEPAAELVSEHRRLVAVLRSPSHKDDKEEAERQAAELEEYEEAEKSGKSVKKSVILVKAHVEGYTRSDGTYVRPHEDRRQVKQETKGVDAVSLVGLKNYLEKHGWRVDHVSEKDGSPSSFYLSRSGTLSGKQIRISNHPLGTKNGERQGASWSVNILVDRDLSLADHLHAIENEDYRESNDGFSSGYSYDEWQEESGVD